jgi:hypothetical protein
LKGLREVVVAREQGDSRMAVMQEMQDGAVFVGRLAILDSGVH